MKTIIAGSREIKSYKTIEDAVNTSGFKITEVVCGCADGVDAIGFGWGRENDVPVNFFPAWENQLNWALDVARPGETVHRIVCYHRGAGYERNSRMAKYAEALIAVWDGKSPGTKNMIETATKLNLKIFIQLTRP